MRKTFLFSAGMVLALTALASVSYAGDWHSGISLICQDCHVMHYSQTEGYNPNGGGTFTPLAAGPHEFLLRNDINNLCLSCHDGGSSAPDVLGAHGNGYVRQAGALNDGGSTSPYFEHTGHSLGSTEVAPGGTWSNAAGMRCTDCHGAHGNATSYRNLGGFGTAAGGTFSLTYASVTNDLTKWVFEDANSGVTAAHYGAGSITFNEPDAVKSKYAELCKSCHTTFHGDAGDAATIGGVLVGANYEEFKRHPALTSNIGAIGGGHSRLDWFASKANQVQVMSPGGIRAGSYTTAHTDLTPSCMSCHKGHGNQNAFGLIFMLGTGTLSEQGDSGVDARNMCRQCHRMGGTATTY